jgi:protein O-GlcNAc transferase
MTTNPTSGAHSGAISGERSPKVTDLRAPTFGGERASSLLGLAKGAVRRGEHRLAARLFRRALEKEPDNIEGTLGLAAAELMLGNGTETEKLAFRALELAPNAPEPRLTLANLRIAQERHQEAIQLLRDAVTVDPGFAAGFSRLGTILTALGEYAAAKPILLRALALDPADADALNSIGNVVLAQGDAAGAALHFERAVAANPGWIKPRVNLATALERLGRMDDAMDALEGALAQDPANEAAKVYLAGLLHRAGNIRRALQFLDEITDANPDHVGALFLTGLIHVECDETAEAVAPLEKAYALAPGSNDIRVNLACAYRGVDRLEEALILAESAVAANPKDILALNTVGSIYIDLARYQDAIGAFERVLSLDPNTTVGMINLANALMARDRAADAIPHLERALDRGTKSPDALRLLGFAHRDTGNFAKAEAALRRAVDLNPDDSRALYALSSVLDAQRRSDEVIPIADRLLKREPELVHAYIVKALAQDPEGGLATIAKALALDPDNVDALLVSGTLNDNAGLAETALSCYERALVLRPDNQKARSRRADIILSICDWTRRAALVAEVKDALADGNTTDGLDVFNLQALDVSYAEIARAARGRSEKIVETLGAAGGDSWVPRLASGNHGKIRVGYLLPYTWFHSLPMVLRQIVSRHDRSRFEVIGFTTNVSPRNEPFEHAYQGTFDEFHKLIGLTPKQAAKRIGAAGIDILIEVSGHTAISCLPVAAFRPAPIQAHMLGYSITTGAPFIDYLITDEIYIPRDQAALGTEQPVYMPNSFMPATRQNVAKGPLNRRQAGLPDDAFVLANFNHPCKFEPQAFAAWMDILKQVPNAVLWLGQWFKDTSRNLRRNASDCGVAPDRLIFAPLAEHADHLQRLALADLALDNLLHGGGITTIDAIAAGLPVLTVSGDTPSSRLGATLLHGVGMDDLVEDSVDAYVARAIHLATHPDDLAALRRRLAANLDDAPLFDIARYVRDLERGYEAMWARHQAGLPPQLIDLKAPH